MLLLEIRCKTISYASFKKKMEREKEEMLLKEINTLQKNVTDDNVKLLEDKLNQLQEIRAIKIQGSAVRSKVRWMTEGEKTSKCFCSLENWNFSCKAMMATFYMTKQIFLKKWNIFIAIYASRERQMMLISVVLMHKNCHKKTVT